MSSRLASIVQSHGLRRVVAFLLALILQQSFGRWIYDRIRRLPPGPVPVPILGNFVLLSEPNKPPGLHRDFWRLAQQYGDIYTLRMGSNLGVVINSPDLAFETYNEKQDETSRRPNLPSFEVLTHFQGVAMNNGPRWRSIRTMLQTVVTNKQLGLEAGPMISEELDATLFWLKGQVEAGHASDFDLRQLCRREALNIAMRRLFSFRYDTTMTPEYYNMQDNIRLIFEQIAQASPSDFMPIFKYFPDPAQDKFKVVCKDLHAFLEVELARHKKDVGKRQGKEMDFMDSLLVIQKKSQADLEEWKTSSDPEIKAKPEPIVPTDTDIKIGAWDMMAGAIDTAATTMEWSLYLLVNFPQVQAKVQEELDRVVGPNRLPTVDDIPNLPYCTAALDEIVRFKHFAPQGLPHEADEDITIGGYNIPKGTQIFLNFFSLHHDPRSWKNPEEFRPERFLEEDKHLLDTILHSETHFKDKASYKFIPFGQGRRRCVGYGIGRIVVFLKFVSWLHCFKWESPNGQPMDLDTEILGITMMPAEQKIRAIPRPASKILKGEKASGLVTRIESR